MGENMKNRKRSVLFEWAGSYLVVLLIPLITIFLNYYFNMETIKEEIYSAHKVVLDHTGNEIDRIMEQQINVYNNLYWDEFFSSWVSHREKNAEFYYDASRLCTQMRNYIKYTADIGCLLYMVDEDYVIYNPNESAYFYANNAKHLHVSLNTFYEEFPDYEEWIGMLSGEYNNEFIFATYLNGMTDEKCLVYADSLELTGNKLVNIFISVPIKKLTELTDSQTFLMYHDDQIEQISPKVDSVTTEILELLKNGRTGFQTEELMGIVKQSAHEEFRYCMLIEQRQFWMKSLHVRNLFIISLTITVLAAFGVVSVLLKRNFQPVSRLLEAVGGEKKPGNEFYQIELSYRRLKNENKSIRQIIQNQREALLGSYLLSVMQQRRNCLSENEIDFFQLDREKILLLSGIRVLSEDHLLRFAVDNVFTELMTGEEFYRIEDGNFMLYLFFVSRGKETELKENLQKQAVYMQELFLEKWEACLEFREVISEGGISRLADLYQALRRKFTGRQRNMEENSDGSENIRGIVADIIEYVDGHYNNSDLNISTIADSMNKNPKYISRVFKENMGEGILDYVNRIRISKAKEIIATRLYSTEEAGLMAGYASNQTFRRAFIKVVGITPGKYMDSLRSHGQ